MLTDGSHGADQMTGHGVVIRNDEGQVIFTRGEQGGKRANNQIAEFEAALCGLRYALELGATEVTLVSDNSTVVHSGQLNLYEPLHTLREMLHAEGARLERFEIVKGSREEVEEAHQYATAGRLGRKREAPGETLWRLSCYFCHERFEQAASVDSFTMVCPACQER